MYCQTFILEEAIYVQRNAKKETSLACGGSVSDPSSGELPGVLALSGDDDYPYAVPISYVFDGAKLYFHCAKDGHKLDAIQRSSKASFCVIDQDQIVPEKYTTYFRSVIAFGQIRIIQDEKEKRAAIEKLAKKYSPDEDAAAAGRKSTGSGKRCVCLKCASTT